MNPVPKTGDTALIGIGSRGMYRVIVLLASQNGKSLIVQSAEEKAIWTDSGMLIGPVPLTWADATNEYQCLMDGTPVTLEIV